MTGAGIHSLLTLLVGAEGKHTARAWLCESTARMAVAARVNSDDPHSGGTIQSKKGRESHYYVNLWDTDQL